MADNFANLHESSDEDADSEVSSVASCSTPGARLSRGDELREEVSQLILSSLERSFNVTCETREILRRFGDTYDAERIRAQKNKEYRDSIRSRYQPMYREIYTMDPARFFVPSFLTAIRQNTEDGFRNIISEPSPGILTFDMLQPEFCQKMTEEVNNFEHWARDARFNIMRPTTMNKFGCVLDDIGMDTMLAKMTEDFIRPISTIFFRDVGGATIDSHHGYIVQYAIHRDQELGLHVDDTEITLNVCLGKQFSGGDLFFHGIRCENHVNGACQSRERYEYSHVPGRAVLHRGRHRHGAHPTTSGHRINMLLWCTSSVIREMKKYQTRPPDCSVFREMKKYQTRPPDWCSECQREKKERQHHTATAMLKELQKLSRKTDP